MLMGPTIYPTETVFRSDFGGCGMISILFHRWYQSVDRSKLTPRSRPPLAVSGAGSLFGIPCYLSGMQWARDSWVVSSKVREERSPPRERQGMAVPALACCKLGHREGASGFQGFCFTSSADGDLVNPMPCEGPGEVGSRECWGPGVWGSVGESQAWE